MYKDVSKREVILFYCVQFQILFQISLKGYIVIYNTYYSLICRQDLMKYLVWVNLNPKEFSKIHTTIT